MSTAAVNAVPREPWPPSQRPPAPVAPAWRGLFLVPAPILPTSGGRTTPARRRPGRTAAAVARPSERCAPSRECTRLAIGGSTVLKLSRPRAASSTPSRRRCSPGGAEPLMRETSSFFSASKQLDELGHELGIFCVFPPYPAGLGPGLVALGSDLHDALELVPEMASASTGPMSSALSRLRSSSEPSRCWAARAATDS